MPDGRRDAFHGGSGLPYGDPDLEADLDALGTGFDRFGGRTGSDAFGAGPGGGRGRGAGSGPGEAPRASGAYGRTGPDGACSPSGRGPGSDGGSADSRGTPHGGFATPPVSGSLFAAPGTGRRRRAPAEESGYFAPLRPAGLDGPPAPHPEHRDHLAPGGRPAPSGPGGVPEPAPEDEWPGDWADFDAFREGGARAGRGGRPGAAPHVGPPPPRPRQEYLDAFDAAFETPKPPPAPAPAEAPAAVVTVSPARTAEGPQGRRLSRGRALSGIAAAAVATTLAVLVGAQLERGHHGGDRPDGTAPTVGDTPPGPAESTGPTGSTTPGAASGAAHRSSPSPDASAPGTEAPLITGSAATAAGPGVSGGTRTRRTAAGTQSDAGPTPSATAGTSAPTSPSAGTAGSGDPSYGTDLTGGSGSGTTRHPGTGRHGGHGTGRTSGDASRPGGTGGRGAGRAGRRGAGGYPLSPQLSPAGRYSAAPGTSTAPGNPAGSASSAGPGTFAGSGTSPAPVASAAPAPSGGHAS